jgi:hypothetical protein
VSGKGGIVNSAIFNIVLASIALFTGTAAARSHSFSFGHARYASPSWTSRYASASASSARAIAPQSRLSARNLPDDQAIRPSASNHRGPSAVPVATAAPRTETFRRNVSGDESPQLRNDYRQIRAERGQVPDSNIAPARRQNSIQPAFTSSATAESPYWGNDYRNIHAGSHYAPVSYVAPANAPNPVQSAYPANAAAPGYNMNVSNNALPIAGLFVDAVSAAAEHMLASETYETDPTDDGNDRGFRYDDAAR